MKSIKKILLFILLFLSILFIKNNIYASFDYEFEGQQKSITDLPFDTTEHPDFVLSYNTGDSCFQVGYPQTTPIGRFFVDSSGSYGNKIQYTIGDTSDTGHWVYYNCEDSTSSWSTQKVTSGYSLIWSLPQYSTLDIYSSIDSDEIFFQSSKAEEYIFPYIADTDEVLSNLDDVDDILVFPGDITKEQLPMVFSIYDSTNESQIFSTNLDTSSPYYLYIVENPDDYWFEINTSEFKEALINNNTYLFNIYAHNDVNEFTITRSITYQGTTYVPPTDEQLQTDAIKDQTEKIEEQTEVIKNQTEKIEEQTEVNKGIFARIGEILSYINPLSENFFAYKLVDLLIDALKSLFVPEEGFFNNWIADINDYFSERFGMVYSSIDFVVDFLTRLSDISSNLNTDYTIHIPEFKLFEATLIPEYSYNLADLLENETFKNIHTIYLCIIDVIMFLWLLIFARNTFAEIFGGRFIDDVFGAVESDSVSYSKYERHQENKTRYTREQNLKRYKNK